MTPPALLRLFATGSGTKGVPGAATRKPLGGFLLRCGSPDRDRGAPTRGGTTVPCTMVGAYPTALPFRVSTRRPPRPLGDAPLRPPAALPAAVTAPDARLLRRRDALPRPPLLGAGVVCPPAAAAAVPGRCATVSLLRPRLRSREPDLAALLLGVCGAVTFLGGASGDGETAAVVDVNTGRVSGVGARSSADGVTPIKAPVGSGANAASVALPAACRVGSGANAGGDVRAAAPATGASGGGDRAARVSALLSEAPLPAAAPAAESKLLPLAAPRRAARRLRGPLGFRLRAPPVARRVDGRIVVAL